MTMKGKNMYRHYQNLDEKGVQIPYLTEPPDVPWGEKLIFSLQILYICIQNTIQKTTQIQPEVHFLKIIPH